MPEFGHDRFFSSNNFTLDSRSIVKHEEAMLEEDLDNDIENIEEALEKLKVLAKEVGGRKVNVVLLFTVNC